MGGNAAAGGWSTHSESTESLLRRVFSPIRRTRVAHAAGGLGGMEPKLVISREPGAKCL